VVKHPQSVSNSHEQNEAALIIVSLHRVLTTRDAITFQRQQVCLSTLDATRLWDATHSEQRVSLWCEQSLSVKAHCWPALALEMGMDNQIKK